MHAQLWRGVLPQHLFAPRPAPRFGEPCADADVAALAAMLREHAGEVAAVVLEPIVQVLTLEFYFNSTICIHS